MAREYKIYLVPSVPNKGSMSWAASGATASLRIRSNDVSIMTRVRMKPSCLSVWTSPADSMIQSRVQYEHAMPLYEIIPPTVWNITADGMKWAMIGMNYACVWSTHSVVRSGVLVWTWEGTCMNSSRYEVAEGKCEVFTVWTSVLVWNSSATSMKLCMCEVRGCMYECSGWYETLS